ncbi:MAG: FAD-binding oxidoreductase [Burkholderiales bacterium]|nr:FAD-binding oxidoreductase [Burkholderiales bacterium]
MATTMIDSFTVPLVRRRRLLGAAIGAMPAWAGAADLDATPAPPFAAPPALAPMRASRDRIIDISVCTRPFRATGPRIEAERMGRQLVVHNYGHGGSGWSLSWGSARLAVQMALAARERQIGVIGCGAIGLTSALVAQRAGLRVRIYTRERPPEVRSSAATGVWSPSSRICTEEHATPAFQRQWEAMTRHSFHVFQSLLGLPGAPVEWCDGYLLSDQPFDQPPPAEPERDTEPAYPHLEGLLSDLRPRARFLARGEHPFPVPNAARYTQMVFNLATYQRMLMDDFLRNGGQIEQRDFASPRQFASLKERTIIHATGYGARALLGDNSLVPVRGQTAKLIPQPEVSYGLTWRGHNLAVVPRRDGLLVQAQAEGDFGNDDVTPDRAASEAAVERLASLFRT